MTGHSSGAVVDPVVVHLAKSSIDRVLIIDDAFDPPRRDTSSAMLAEFWDRLTRNDAARAEWGAAFEDVLGPADLDDAVLKTLWDRRGEFENVRPLAEATVFAEKLLRLGELQPFMDQLKELNMTVEVIGSEVAVPENCPRLVFVDYYLGPGKDEVATGNSEEMAREVSGRIGKNGERSFVVLMSSESDAEAAQDDFRKKSGLLSGLFGFAAKTTLRDRETLHLLLYSWATDLPARHEIQRFVEALEASVDKARDDFKEKIRGLTVSEYANIQWLSLQEEGHPLGDYMLWLYRSLLSHLLHNHPRVLEQQRALDRISIERFTSSTGGPSTDLAAVYQCAVTEPGVEPLGPHPRAGDGATDTYLSFGDLFWKDAGDEVYAVLTAPCDLAYSPGRERRFPSDRFVLFESGKFQAADEPPGEASFRTDFFVRGGRAYRILWTHRDAIWKEYGVAGEWLKGGGFERRGRLSMPYALELQRSFANHLTRIGMPVRPPMTRAADVELFCKGEDDNWTLLKRIKGGAHVFGTANNKGEEEEVFALHPSCARDLVAAVKDVQERLEQEQDALHKQRELIDNDDKDRVKKLKALEGRLIGLTNLIAKVVALSSVRPHWLPLVKPPCPLPPKGNGDGMKNRHIYLCRDAACSGRYKPNEPIAIHIRTIAERGTEGDTSGMGAPDGDAEAKNGLQATASSD